MNDCVFCKIVEGTEPAREVVYETADTLAFIPLQPAAVGHTLVIPKRHIRDIWALDKELAATLIEAVLDVSRGLRASVLKPEGLNIISSAGKAASQSIFHLHIHVVPRWEGDHFGNIWPPPDSQIEHATRDIVKYVRAACTHVPHLVDNPVP